MKPKIFIGSSVKSKDIAETLQELLTHDAKPVVWHQAFPLSNTTIDTLLEKFSEADFAIFVFADDDELISKSSHQLITRDNVIFEAGLFMGMHGKSKCFVVIPRGLTEFHLPSDLYGFTTADYDKEFFSEDAPAALGPVVTQIKRAVKAIERGEQLQLTVKTKVSLTTDPLITYKLKLFFKIKNTSPFPIVVDDVSFKIGTGIDAHKKGHKRFDATTYKPDLMLFSASKGVEYWEHQAAIAPGKEVKFYIPMEPPYDQAKVETALTAKTTGTVKFRCTSLDKQIRTRRFEEKF